MKTKVGAGVATMAIFIALWVAGGGDPHNGGIATPTPTVTVTPTPTTPPEGACLASDNCYPKSGNVGAGATGIPAGHTASNNCTTNPADAQIMTDCLYASSTTINTTGSGATIRYSRFKGMVTHTGAGTLVVEYSTFGPDSGCSSYDNSFTGPNYAVRNSRFNEHVGEGPRVSYDNILIEENFIGPMCSNPGDHADGIQGYGGGNNIVITHNTIDQRTASDVTSPIFMADNSSSADVRYNLVAGGGYSIRLHDDYTPDHGPWVLIGNRIVTPGYGYGPMSNSGTTFTASTCQDNRLVTIDGGYNITSTGATIGC